MLPEATHKLIELVRGSQDSSGAFPNRYGSSLAFIETNYYACYCLSRVEGADFNRQSLIDWVVSCRSADGGYGAYPDGISRLAATYWAVSIFRLLGYPVLGTGRDIAWILTKQTGNGQFTDPNSRHSPIQQTWYAVKSLELFKAVKDMDQIAVGHFARAVLDHEMLNIWDAMSVIDVLQTIGMLDDTSRQKVFYRFVSPAFVDIRRLPINQHISWLTAYAELLNLTRYVSPEQTEVAMKLLGERTSQAFGSYVESVRNNFVSN